MKNIITTPISEAAVRELKVGDIIYISGRVITGRDDVHHRIVDEKIPSPVDFNGNALFHAGPIIREEPGNNQLISIGPTSSIRMEDYAAEFMALTGVKVMIGKGGMGPKTTEACRRHQVIHCVSPGGCAVSTASQFSSIDGVYWRELGMPECMWVLTARELGPLIVTIDTHGNNMFMANRQRTEERKVAVMAPIVESVRHFMNV